MNRSRICTCFISWACCSSWRHASSWVRSRQVAEFCCAESMNNYPVCKRTGNDRLIFKVREGSQAEPSAPAQAGRTVTRERFCRSEEHTSELQSRENLVCRLLLEKKNKEKT